MVPLESKLELLVLSNEPDAKLPLGNVANVLTPSRCPVNVFSKTP